MKKLIKLMLLTFTCFSFIYGCGKTSDKIGRSADREVTDTMSLKKLTKAL